MIEKVFKGKVNGKEYTSVSDFQNALCKALLNEEDINASSWYETKEIADVKPKQTKAVLKNTEVDRFTSNLKKFNDRFEKLLESEDFNPFKFWDALL